MRQALWESERRLAITSAVIRRALLFVLVATASCGKCGASKHADETTTSLVEVAPVPAPDKRLADVVIAHPNATWAKLQRGVGGAAGILPATAGGMFCTVLGLDPAMASEIDGSSPFYGVLAGDPVAPSFAFALKLGDVRKARTVLLEAETARFSWRDAGGMTELLAKGGADRSPGVVMGIAPSGHLLIASSSTDLTSLGPYVTRSLPAEPLPDGGAIVASVPRAAIEGVLVPRLDALWATTRSFLAAADAKSRRDHGGRAPDFGDAGVLLERLDAFVK